MRCSVLASHLYDLHIKESPNCFACNVKEDCQHFFFNCELYRYFCYHSIELVNRLSTCNLQTFLYGDPGLGLEDNAKIFEAVHNFIHESGRFYFVTHVYLLYLLYIILWYNPPAIVLS